MRFVIYYPERAKNYSQDFVGIGSVEAEDMKELVKKLYEKAKCAGKKTVPTVMPYGFVCGGIRYSIADIVIRTGEYDFLPLSEVLAKGSA